jgi:hypothetical protein
MKTVGTSYFNTETSARGTFFPPDKTCTGARVARVAPYLLLLETTPALRRRGLFRPLSGQRMGAVPSAAQPQPFFCRDPRRVRRSGWLRHALPIQAAPRSTFQEACQ